MVPVGELHLVPLASLDCCGTSLVGMPSRDAGAGIGDDLPADIFLPPPRGFGQHAALLRIEHAGLLAALGLLNSLIAATMRSLTSPVMAPLYWPTQARSDCSASRSACAMALAVSAGVCSAGPDRDGRDRLRLGAGGGRRRHLRLRVAPSRHEYQCCRQPSIS